jgi:putative transposase
MNGELRIASGTKVVFDGSEYIITQVIDFKNVVAQKMGTRGFETLPISQLKSAEAQLEDASSTKSSMIAANDEEWNKALDKQKVIDSLLNPKNGIRTNAVKAAKTAGVCRATIYKWIKKAERTGRLDDLLDEKRDGGRRKSRLSPEHEVLIDKALKEFYLKKRWNVIKTHEELKKYCQNAGIQAPHLNTLHKRISWLSDYDKIAATKGKELAEQLCSPKPGRVLGADTLLSLVQMDHMYLDIIIVDDRDRLPIGRAYLTLAICVFSRMVVGLYVSLDHPSAFSAGMCIVNAILPKEPWLQKLGVDIEWPCWGKMITIHMDNAKEFRGKTIRRACQEYKIDTVFRAVKKPRYGAHIERYLGTIAKELKSLPGATFSTTDERGCYDSSGNAALTFSEIEQYLVNFVVGDYHQRIHSELGMSPIAKWHEGVFGNAQTPGRGLPPFVLNENRLRLDFLPYFEHVIHPYGVRWMYIHYYDDVFRHWCGVKKPDHPKESLMHRFHYDPRDISILFFYDRRENSFLRIPYRNPSQPAMSKWERDAIRKKLQNEGIKNIDEELIFATRKKNHAIVNNAVKETKHMRMVRQRDKHHKASEKPKDERPRKPRAVTPTLAPSIYNDIEAFDDVDS